MAQVRCPQCGAINGTTAPDYPFCIGCQDNLAKCGYCGWFDPELVVCTNPAVAGVFDVAVDATPPCDQHTPGESVLAPGRGIWPMIVVGIVALLALFYSVYQVQKPLDLAAEEPQDYLHLVISGDIHGAVVDQPYAVTVKIVNSLDQAVSGVRLQVSKDAWVRFKLPRMLPGASAREDAGEWLSFIYDDVGPSTTLEFKWSLIPRKKGTHQLAVRLISQGTRFHGLALLPVRVRAAPAQKDIAAVREGGNEARRRTSSPQGAQ